MSSYVYKNCRLCNIVLTFQTDLVDGLCSGVVGSCYSEYYLNVIHGENKDFDQLLVWERAGVMQAEYQALFDTYLEQNFTTENLKYDHTGIKYTGSEVFGVEQEDP
jgi:hypothetical protein